MSAKIDKKSLIKLIAKAKTAREQKSSVPFTSMHDVVMMSTGSKLVSNLMTAVTTRNIKQLKKSFALYKEGMARTGIDAEGKIATRNIFIGAFHKAVSLDFQHIVELFLEERFDINAQYHDSDTPLIVACKHNQTKLVLFLLSKGANPNIKNKGNVVALVYAAINDSLEIVQYLLGMKADVNTQDISGMTPLLYAK